MNVAILGPVFTSKYFGGVATFDENLAMAFRELGHNVCLYSNQKEVNKNSEGRVKVETINFISASRIKNVDVIICSLQYIMYMPIIKAKCKIAFLHGFFQFAHYGMLKTLAAVTFQKVFFRFADFVVSNSRFTSLVNSEMYGIKSDGYVHLGVSYDYKEHLKNVQEKVYNRKPYTLLYTGRLVKPKRIDNLIRAVHVLKEKYQLDVQLNIVGEGEFKGELSSLVEELGLCESVCFANRKSQEEIAGEYLSNSIFVSLNPFEPYGITFCEALMAGCKIICPDTGGQVEVLSQYADRVKMVHEDEPENIAAAAAQLFMGNSVPLLSTDKFDYKKTALDMLQLVGRE